ncbi:MAG: nicotinate-nucleotide adenylyltransferase [Cyanobacteria bacterium P01_A01_bin.116]
MFSPPWSKPTRVALFGTSADPPHLGHRGILDWLSEAFDHVAVWAAENPYKPKQSPLADRAQMLRLLIETLPNQDRVGVYQSLSDRYTIYSIARAQQLWPKATFTFVVGADLIAQLPSWYEADQIFAKADILVFPRPGHPIEGSALEALQKKAQVAIAHPPQQHNIASSRYRQSTCDDVPSDLPPVIRDYITQHNLYPCLQTPLARPQEKHQEKYQENYREHSHPQVHPEATLKAHR